MFRFSIRFSVFVFILLFFKITASSAVIFINEILAANISNNRDDNTCFNDWVELYNSGDEWIDLENYYLTDDPKNPVKFKINQSRIIPARSFLIIFLDEKGVIQDGDIHPSFSLDTEGEFFGIYDPDLNVIDTVTFGKQTADVSFGRNLYNINEWRYFNEPTYDAENGNSGISVFQLAGEVNFPVQSGFYSDYISITIESSQENSEIRYTLDGSYPGKNSNLYEAPITISKSTVVRARCYKNGYINGPVKSSTYFINETEYNLPVISLSTDWDHFWNDNNGIYVRGNNGTVSYCYPDSANWYQDWERPINFEFFDTNNVRQINQIVGTKIFGACTRELNLKSLALISRKDYGKGNLEYKFFRDKDINDFKSLVLRNGGNDFERAFIRDGVLQNIVKNRMDIDYQEFQPVIVYLNGEYFAMLNMREKMNEHYVESNYGFDSDEIDVIEDYVAMNGHDSDFIDLWAFIENNDLAEDTNYNYVAGEMDVNEFMNYYITEIFYSNTDWLDNNIKFWRHAPTDSKWRWFLFDLDWGFNHQDSLFNPINAATADNYGTFIFVNLLKNQRFKNEFLQRFAAHINTTFTTDRMKYFIDSIYQVVSPYIEKNSEIWGYPLSREFWDYHVFTIMYDFADVQPNIARGLIMNKWEIDGMYSLNASTDNEIKGVIKINEVDVEKDHNGLYFSNIPVRLTAVPKAGYKFSGWTGDIISSDPEIFITKNSDFHVTANFTIGDSVNNLFINEIVSDNESGFPDNFDEYDDWIEIYNANDFDVNLAGLFISDSLGSIDKWRIPGNNPTATTIPAKGFKVLFADNDLYQGPLHLPFKLSKDGEKLILSQKINDRFTIIDSFTFKRQYTDIATGRLHDGSDTIQFVTATPGAANMIRMVKKIYINEVMASNNSVIADEYNEYDDWIELYNDNDFPVDIGGLFISDTLEDFAKCRISSKSPDLTTIPPKGFIVLWADDQKDQGALHLNFKLNTENEEVCLFQEDGKSIIDSLFYSSLLKNISYGKFPEVSNHTTSLSPSPGEKNKTFTLVSGIRINEITASQNTLKDEHGEYDDWIELYNDNDFEVNIGGLFISDTIEDRLKYRIPTNSPELTTIPAKGYIVLWADGQLEQGVLHLNFKLDGDGEELILTNTNGIMVLDSVSYPDLYANFSFSRTETGKWTQMRPTPDTVNVNKIISGLKITEIMPDNNSIADDMGEFSDWLEIYNSNDFPVDIGGLFITDSINDPSKDRISSKSPENTTIQPNGYILIYASNSDSGALHLKFKLSRSGEKIGLFYYDKETLIDSVTYAKCYRNSSISYIKDRDNWFFVPPTPGNENLIPQLSNIRVNELMSKNKSYLQDEKGEYDDWIEIYNDNDYAINIGGLYITDSIGDPSPDRISTECADSTTIPAKGYLVLWADDQEEQGVQHLSFNLNKENESIAIYGYDKTALIDSVSYLKNYTNWAYAYISDRDKWFQLPPTPGVENIFPQISNIRINEFMTKNKSYLQDEKGEYDDWIEIYNDNDYAVNIGGLYITDSIGDPSPDRISTDCADSTTIPAKGYMILWADDQEEQGVQHLSFNLNKENESIAIYGYDKTALIDSVSYTKNYTNWAFTYISDRDKWFQLPPTPGMKNIFPQISNIRINEFMSKNKSFLKDEKGEYDDWIEIYNDNDYAVNIGGLYITDSIGDPSPDRISTDCADSTTIPAKGYMVLWADDQEEQGVTHLGFKLGKDNESIGLYGYEKSVVIDTHSYSKNYSNSANAFISEKNNWFQLPPTPGSKNIIPKISNIYINEFMTRNTFVIQDEFKEYDDWIEIFNNNDYPVNVAGLYLTDSLNYPVKHRISCEYPDSTTIPAKGFLLLWADNQEDQGILHLDFKLSESKEEIGLYNFDYKVIDTVSYTRIPLTKSFGRIPDGHSVLAQLSNLTPGRSNKLSSVITDNGDIVTVFVYPNPVSTNTTIEIILNEPNDVILKIFNLSGSIQHEQKLEENGNKGIQFNWNRTDVNNNPVQCGLYFYSIQSGKSVFTGKITVAD